MQDVWVDGSRTGDREPQIRETDLRLRLLPDYVAKDRQLEPADLAPESRN